MMKLQSEHRKHDPKLLAVSSKTETARSGKARGNKSFQVLLSCNSDELVPLKFSFFKETTSFKKIPDRCTHGTFSSW